VKTNTNAGKTIAAAIFVALAFSPTSATAGIIVQPNAVNAFTNPGETTPNGWLNDANYKGSSTHDGTGLSDPSLVANGVDDIGNAGANLAALPTHNVMFSGASDGSGRYNPIAGIRTAPFLLQYATDKTYDFTGVYLWNYTEHYADGPYAGWYNNRGISQAQINFYGDAASGFAFRGYAIANFTQAPQSSSQVAQYVSFGQVIPNAQYIAFYINSSFADGTNINASSIVGLNEIRFTAVPEPATWALLAGGLTTVMVLRRRRKS